MHEVTDVCVTQNHQSYMLVCGKASGSARYLIDTGVTTSKDFTAQNGVWVLDRENHTWKPEANAPYIETSWLGSGSSQQRKSIIRVYLQLRETQKPDVALTERTTTGVVTTTPAFSLKVSVYTDWRKSRTIDSTVVATPVSYAPMFPEEDPPPAWEQESWSSTNETWKRRRPFWTKVEISVPSCEVFKLRLEPDATVRSDSYGKTEVPYRFEFIALSFDMIHR